MPVCSIALHYKPSSCFLLPLQYWLMGLDLGRDQVPHCLIFRGKKNIFWEPPGQLLAASRWFGTCKGSARHLSALEELVLQRAIPVASRLDCGVITDVGTSTAPVALQPPVSTGCGLWLHGQDWGWHSIAEGGGRGAVVGAWSGCLGSQGSAMFPAEIKLLRLSPWPYGEGAAMGSTACHSPLHPGAGTHEHLQAPKRVTVR